MLAQVIYAGLNAQELVRKFIFFFAQILWIKLSKFNINTYTVYNIRQQPKGNYGATAKVMKTGHWLLAVVLVLVMPLFGERVWATTFRRSTLRSRSIAFKKSRSRSSDFRSFRSVFRSAHAPLTCSGLQFQSLSFFSTSLPSSRSFIAPVNALCALYNYHL